MEEARSREFALSHQGWENVFLEKVLWLVSNDLLSDCKVSETEGGKETPWVANGFCPHVQMCMCPHLPNPGPLTLKIPAVPGKYTLLPGCLTCTSPGKSRLSVTDVSQATRGWLNACYSHQSETIWVNIYTSSNHESRPAAYDLTEPCQRSLLNELINSRW